MAANDEKPVVIGEEKARQGGKSYQVLLVLIISMILAGLALAILLGWFGSLGSWPR
jgi:hypothetical protein